MFSMCLFMFILYFVQNGVPFRFRHYIKFRCFCQFFIRRAMIVLQGLVPQGDLVALPRYARKKRSGAASPLQHQCAPLHYFLRYTTSTAISAGLTPIILLACPILSGLNFLSFCLASIRRF